MFLKVMNWDFFIGDNGHLYITAKNIYKEINNDVTYPQKYIELMESYINDDEIDKSDIDTEKWRKLIDKYKSNNKNLQKKIKNYWWRWWRWWWWRK